MSTDYTPTGFESVTAQNVGQFPMSEEFVRAKPETLVVMSGILIGMSRDLTDEKKTIVAKPIDEYLDRLEARNDLPAQILASYIGAVARHANSLGVTWPSRDGSTLMEIRSNLLTSSVGLGDAHIDFSASIIPGVRLQTVNRYPTEVSGVEDLKAGEIVQMVHAKTWHNAPAYKASARKPRMLIASDFFLDPKPHKD
jgi:hypothetical protein